MNRESTIHVEAVRIPAGLRTGPDTQLEALADSIEKTGLRHPITVWSDGTLISGSRRERAYDVLRGRATNFFDYLRIPVVTVDNIEDAAKRLLDDNGDEADSVPMKPSEICRLWEVLRKLDEPAAAVRLNDARRRGVELRKQTQRGQREPGRSRHRGTAAEYLMETIAQPFGMAEATASRLWSIYSIANSMAVSPERSAAARTALADIDAGRSSIWANYSALISGKRAPSGPRAVVPTATVSAARQRAMWDRSLPQLEGLVSGLTELGTPNPALTWNEVGPVHARLMKARRDLEKIIKNYREISQS